MKSWWQPCDIRLSNDDGYRNYGREQIKAFWQTDGCNGMEPLICGVGYMVHMYPEYLKVHFSNLVSSIRWFHRVSLYYYWWPLDTIHRWKRGSPRANVFISKYEPRPSFPPKYLLVIFPLLWKELTLSTINDTNYQGLIALLVEGCPFIPKIFSEASLCCSALIGWDFWGSRTG